LDAGRQVGLIKEVQEIEMKGRHKRMRATDFLKFTGTSI
jgi:hypothetical protein